MEQTTFQESDKTQLMESDVFSVKPDFVRRIKMVKNSYFKQFLLNCDLNSLRRLQNV